MMTDAFDRVVGNRRGRTSAQNSRQAASAVAATPARVRMRKFARKLVERGSHHSVTSDLATGLGLQAVRGGLSGSGEQDRFAFVLVNTEASVDPADGLPGVVLTFGSPHDEHGVTRAAVFLFDSEME